MKSYSFKAYGHHNILSIHKNTLEITKDKELTKEGDCIIAVGAEFELPQLLRFSGRALMTFEAGGESESVEFDVNPGFSSDHEIVCRLGGFASERTYGLNCSKSSRMLSRKFVERLKQGGPVTIIISQKT